MKKFILTCIVSLCTIVTLFAVTKSQIVVYINGEKYYIHTVESKETIYSIAKAYEVTEQVIIDLNSADLKVGENIKIPFQTDVDASNQKGGLRTMFTFSKHTVEKGETLYSISRKYEISIDTIIEDNPEVDPISLPVGHKLLIRKKMKGLTSEKQSREEWEDYRSDLNLTSDSDGYIYHIVKRGETIYSLSKEGGISEEEFIELNNLSDGLKAGAIVKYPIQESDDEEQLEEQPEIGELKQVEMRSLRGGDTLKVALFLPLTKGEATQRQFADLYKGFEMGLDSVKLKFGRDIILRVYNTERNIDVVASIVESDEFKGTNLIVGPIYENLLPPVIKYAESTGTPVVSPLALINNIQSSLIFQLAPMPEIKYQKVEPMIADTKHVTLIYTEQVDTLFEANILKLLGERPYDTHTYIYEHPNEVAEKLKKNKESAGDMSKFINNKKDNTIIIMSSSETDVDRILAALSSAQINIVARGGDAPRWEVLGNSDWSRYRNIDRTILFKNSVVLLSSYHAKRDNRIVRLFDSNFIKKYGSLPTLYAYRGYDVAMIFGEARYSDMEYNLEGRTYTPLQSQYRFETDEQRGIHINREWIRVNYKTNYTITIE